ncbi:MAG: hypothetical protein M5U27_15240 [Gaiella sp.]|nr:hypothetical protein [Gaiella sp.]
MQSIDVQTVPVADELPDALLRERAQLDRVDDARTLDVADRLDGFVIAPTS